uniref:(northern house mosquito) hypothetical protein n=1 Tax=Culex pipiens TaxID=7175 RepID=A0A8D8F6U6_CULPI
MSHPDHVGRMIAVALRNVLIFTCTAVENFISGNFGALRDGLGHRPEANEAGQPFLEMIRHGNPIRRQMLLRRFVIVRISSQPGGVDFRKANHSDERNHGNR